MYPDQSSIIAIDFIGELLMLTMLVCNVWRLRSRAREDRLLRMMVVCTMVGCLMDQVWFSSIDIDGTVIAAPILISNTLLYVAEMVTCYCWALFINIHMRGSVSKLTRIILSVPIAVSLALLLANLFTPLLFHVDDKSVYYRLPLSALLICFAYSYFVYALGLYIRLRQRSGGLRLFPGWALMFPVVLGGTVQLIYPGAPTFWASVCVGIAGTITSLQNEDIYRDRLSRLYNRAFLEYVCSGKLKRASTEMTGVMIDLNGFKTINDKLGHNVGDQALVNAAHIIRDSVGDIGIATRYAGDEFVVLLNTTDDAVVNQTMDEMRRRFQSFNSTGTHPYELSASMGQFKMVPGKQSVEEFIANIDRAMYGDKKRYYEEHPEADRRASR